RKATFIGWPFFMPKIKEHYKRLAWCYFLLDKKRQPLWTAFFIR
ncbi:MAG: hypothetical protein ACI8XG_001366, partial [Congregibacter sp.]